jgi:hypothetical protein
MNTSLVYTSGVFLCLILGNMKGYIMKTLDDMRFKPNAIGGERAELSFPNGYGASVLRSGGNGMFGGRTAGGTYELAVLKGVKLCYDTYLTDDVLNYQTEQQVNDTLKAIQQLASA